ncbi:YcjX family protein [Devosia sp.]|uniref:YcjX family protein n=1 Tax=Devosia sp. TaxID=1871048 RepID=UPI001ACA3B6C|nr:YcjX family protein [Devosia sp.]MBN9309522.1 YcjX family protein [Devosia sp.]
MPQSPTTITDEIGIALGNLADAAAAPFTPTLRLGVTGLSRAGKTIFITSLIHNLLTGGRLPGFAAMTEGRFIGARLAEHPDAGVPRFAYEQHLAALTGKAPHWPESTRRISQLRLTLKFQSRRWVSGMFGPTVLNLDIVDYPGEWLLDLPLLSLNYAEWSAQALALAKRPQVRPEAERFLNELTASDPFAESSDADAERLATAFTEYLRLSREDGRAMSTLPPGRFLMPGDLEGSPALTFAPLPTPGGPVRSSSLYAMLERRYEAYKAIVVRPFFRDHFARLDRQIVLVDTLRALNAGPAAVADLETALTDILGCFRQGDNNVLTRLVARRIDRILFAATKADHIHSSSHDRLEAVMNRLVAGAARKARFAGAETKSMAIAAVRATRESVIEDGGVKHEVIVGTPEAGETLDGVRYDGRTEIALFPGDLPDNPEALFEDGRAGALKFLRFMPPQRLDKNAEGNVVLPHIRFDRALDYLIGDWLK